MHASLIKVGPCSAAPCSLEESLCLWYRQRRVRRPRRQRRWQGCGDGEGRRGPAAVGERAAGVAAVAAAQQQHDAHAAAHAPDHGGDAAHVAGAWMTPCSCAQRGLSTCVILQLHSHQCLYT